MGWRRRYACWSLILGDPADLMASPPPSPPTLGDMLRTDSLSLLSLPAAQPASPVGLIRCGPGRRAGAPPLPPGPPPRTLAPLPSPPVLPGLAKHVSVLDLQPIRAPPPLPPPPGTGSAPTSNGKAVSGQHLNGTHLHDGTPENGSPPRPLRGLMREERGEWIVPSIMPDHLVRTLSAEVQRSGVADDAIQLAQMLVDAYTSTRLRNETWGMASGFGKRKKLAALAMLQRSRPKSIEPLTIEPSAEPFVDLERKQLVADALAVAMDGATCDKRVLELESVEGRGVVDLPASAEKTVEALKGELEDARDHITLRPPCCPKRRRIGAALPTAKVAPVKDAAFREAVRRRPPEELLKARGMQVVMQTRLRHLAAEHRYHSSRRVAPKPPGSP